MLDVVLDDVLDEDVVALDVVLLDFVLGVMLNVVLDDVLDEDVVALEIVTLDVVINDIVLVVVLSEDWDVTLEDVFVDVFEGDFAVLEDVFVCEVDDVGLEKVDFDELLVFEVVLHVVFDVYAELELGVV
ncbi:hypothetical protein D6D05_08876 [Aureobasidium pullulans]|nr:hypothetical protein D6D05_08876 [Aureobasidium pullulans]